MASTQDDLLARAETLSLRALVYDTALPSSSSQPINTQDTAVTALQRECEELWEEVGQSQTALTTTNIPPVTVSPSDDDSIDSLPVSGPGIEILKAKANRLRAEIHTLSNAPVTVLPDDPAVLQAMVQERLERSVTQLQETLSLVRTQRKDMVEEIAREEEFGRQLHSVVQALQQKLDQSSQEVEGENVDNVYKEILENKTVKAEKYQKQLMKQLVLFVDKHFPLPTEVIFNEVKKKLRSADKHMTLSSTFNLKSILQELMNKCIDHPNDAYITIDHRFWPPYVELLLRCQIVLRHPDDDRRIKLVPFHL